MTAKNYHMEQSVKNTQRIKALLRELPPVCSDYFRSISQTTSSLTRLAYAYDLRLFFQYLCDERITFANSKPELMAVEEFGSITARDIEGFQEYLLQYARSNHAIGSEDNSPTFVQNKEAGIMRKLCSIRSLFEYLFKNEMISANISTLVSLPKRKEKPILFLEQREAQEMIDAVLTGEGLSGKQQSYLHTTRKRDLAILMLFLGTGVRVSELVGIDLSDVDFANNAFMVVRKGGNQTILYYSNQVKIALLEYLSEREKTTPLTGHENAFFLSLQKRRMTVRAVENMVKKYASIAAPLKKKISPHKLRSTFGTNLYQETGDIYLVADALGHADVNTTRRHYAAMTDSRKREAAKRIILPDATQNRNLNE
ncbi:MAG: tyrosine-type recombinase/integrase [Eubacteriales bacterium]|jgi:site-specific recombinase XerD|nr:tyrosine-type recombinase/integrase [Eubacteriales bacterium]MDD4106228.1 tyrosine-type recombinase/integrase [Eubacteriales bacterium]MDD4711402.1 tyrosine-type recombinase/integrase [Eubacteriales bacterium]NLO15622.1 tyrosine-type recombinase/integrase [Clostridiales bacterium]